MDKKKVMHIFHLNPNRLLTGGKIIASYKALSLSLKHHPDLNSKLSEEKKRLCNDRFSSILEAYKYLINQIIDKKALSERI